MMRQSRSLDAPRAKVAAGQDFVVDIKPDVEISSELGL
jgi:hypothetical protein